MKRSTKIIISILVIALLSIILFPLCSQEIRLLGNHTCTITSINGNNITGAFLSVDPYGINYNNNIISDIHGNKINLSEISIGDRIYVYNNVDHTNYACKVVNIENNLISVEEPVLHYYSFSTKDAVIKDINGKKIDVSGLSIGDRINIINKNEKIQPDIAMIFEGHSLENLRNVKKIKVIDKNLAEQEAINNRNMVATKRGVILKTNENSLDVMGAEDTNDLFSVTYDKDIGFKQGQEILIYFNGYIESYPHIISNVGKIEIIKDKSDASIPEGALKYFYSSPDNVNVSVDKLTKNDISFTINENGEILFNQYLIN